MRTTTPDFSTKAFPDSAEEMVMEADMKRNFYEIKERGLLIGIVELMEANARRLQIAGFQVRRVR